jgi:sulfur carrier protein ThiS
VRVEVRRYATLDTPKNGDLPGKPAEVVLMDGGSVAQLIAELGLSTDAVHLVIVNGHILHDRAATLAEGDRVALFPPIGGG